MKLHVYDHCPFCVRARMPFGLKNIPLELHVQLNDDEDTPIAMIGEKMLPILEDEDGYLAESLDIVEKLDGHGGPRIFDTPPRPELAEWMEACSRTVSELSIPRSPVPVYPEFATPEARSYFTRKKEASMGNFAELLSRTDKLVAEMEEALRALVPILPDPDKPSIEDILLFPKLRSLTMVTELNWPDEVVDYRDRMSRLSGVPLFKKLRVAAE